MILTILKYVLYFILFLLSLIIFIAIYIGMRNKYDRLYFKKKFADPSYLRYVTPTDEVYHLFEWQRKINPTIPFNKIVTPGTHDSLTYDWESSYSLIQQYTSYWAETQYLTTMQQLMAGVRYFDARVGICKKRFCDKDTVVVFHGDFSSNTTYESVISQLVEFIEKYPSEMIVWKFRILNNDDEVRKIIEDKKLHSKLNLIPWTEKYFKLSLGELRELRPDKKKAGIIFVSDYYPSTNPTVWPTSKMIDPYDMAALMIDKKGFTSTGKTSTPSSSSTPSSESPTPSSTPQTFKSTMKRIYSDQAFPDDSLTILQMIAEYQTSTKSSMTFSIERISKSINDILFNKSEMPPAPKTGYNVIMIDYLMPKHSNAIINFNPKEYFIANQ